MFPEISGHTVAGVLFLCIPAICFPAQSLHAAVLSLDQDCVMKLAETAGAATTLAEIRKQCSLASESGGDSVEGQAALEKESADAIIDEETIREATNRM